MRRAYKNIVETSDIPVLVKGGPSYSTVLNKINQNIQDDIVRLNAMVQEQDRKQRMLSSYVDQQSVGFQGLINHLNAMIPAAPTGRGLVDFYSSTYVHASNTAFVDQDYGQVTLPILSTQEKMFHTDSNGSVWIPDDSRIRFYTSSTYSAGVIPNDDVFLTSVEDYHGIYGSPDSFFIGGRLPTETYLYLKASLPQTLNTHKLSNRITFHPIPSFSHTLVAIYIRRTNGLWEEVDITYLPWYSSSGVPFLGPTRVHFSPAEITEVCVVLKASEYWGVSEFSVQLVSYDSTANAVVDFSAYSPTTIVTTILGGKDTSTLNKYSITIAGSVVTIPMSQTVVYSSPVLTSVEARW